MGIFNYILPWWAKWVALALIILGSFLAGYSKGAQKEQLKQKADQTHYLEQQLIEQAKKIKELNATIAKDNDARILAEQDRLRTRQQVGVLQKELADLMRQKSVGDIVKERVIYQECKAQPIVVDKLNEILTK